MTMTERYYRRGGEPPTEKDRERMNRYRVLRAAERVARRNAELLKRLAEDD
jgi:hypothetical protein